MIHLNPKNIPCTEPINVKAYFSEFAAEVEELKQFNCLIDSDLVAKCSPDLVKNKNGVYKRTDKSYLWKQLNIETTSTVHRQILSAKTKWAGKIEPKQIISCPAENDQTEDDEIEPDLTANKDIVLVARIYKPFHHNKTISNNIRFTHEFTVLASQRLSELRDVFKCVADLADTRELQHPNEKEESTDNKEGYPSGFLFIDDCFYNDMRHPAAIEYSNEIIKWASQNNLPNCRIAKMEDTKFEDLVIRIGYPYLYRHQANCEHVLVFTDMRLLRPDELQVRAKYPYISCHNYFYRKVCKMCTNNFAEFFITDCDRLPYKTNYLCKDCILAYNYCDGKKVGTFKLYPFYDSDKSALY